MNFVELAKAQKVKGRKQKIIKNKNNKNAKVHCIFRKKCKNLTDLE